MQTVREAFDQAAWDAQHLPQRPDNTTLLRLYGLYKQATEGDCTCPKPGFFDFVGSAKHDAWARLRGTAADTAMQQYIDLVKQLRG